MKNTNLTLKLTCYLIFAALLVWLGIYTFQAMDNPYRTVPVTSCANREIVELNGIVAREETVLYSVYDAVHIKLDEGQRVSARGTVAEAFSSQEALLRAVRLEELQQEAGELNALLIAASAENTQQTDADIQSDIRSLRRSVSKRELADAASLCLTLQTEVFAAFSSPNDILTRLKACNGEIAQLQSQAAANATPIPAPVSGLFSRSVDGWETLTKEDLEQIEPAALRSLLKEKREAPASALGKLVSGTRWYYAALMDAEQAERLRSRRTASVVFGRYYGETLTMKVEWISPASDGVRTVLLSCGEALAETLTTRRQEAELLLSEENGLRIPRRGLHVDEDGSACVYVQTGLRVEKKPVTIVEDFDDYYMVTSDALRVGDEIIVSGKNLFSGKVVG